jgi:hypothetical protein
MRKIKYIGCFLLLISCSNSKGISTTNTKKTNSTSKINPISTTNSKTQTQNNDLIKSDFKSVKNQPLIPGKSEDIEKEVPTFKKNNQVPTRSE